MNELGEPYTGSTVPVPRVLVERLRRVTPHDNDCNYFLDDVLLAARAVVDAVSEREDDAIPPNSYVIGGKVVWGDGSEPTPLSAPVEPLCECGASLGSHWVAGCSGYRSPSPNSEARERPDHLPCRAAYKLAEDEAIRLTEELAKPPRVARSLADLRVGQVVVVHDKNYGWGTSQEVNQASINYVFKHSPNTAVILQDADPPAVDPAVLPTEPEEVWQRISDELPESFWRIAAWDKSENWNAGSLDVADRKRIGLAVIKAVMEEDQ